MEQIPGLDEILTRLTLHEFLLEVVMANQLAGATPEDSTQAKADLPRVAAKGYGVMTANLEAARKLEAMNHRCIEMCERFVEKVARREAEIRATRNAKTK